MATSPAVATFVTNPGIPRGQKAKTLVRASGLPGLPGALPWGLIAASTRMQRQRRAEDGCLWPGEPGCGAAAAAPSARGASLLPCTPLGPVSNRCRTAETAL
jgi:hypothetical protein